MATILICDDQRNLRETLALTLENGGHRVVEAATVKEAMGKLEEASDLVITDLRLPDGSGLDVLRQAKKLDSGRPVLLITAYASTETAVIAMKEGAFEYLEKPFSLEDFHLVVSRALEQASLTRENARLRQALAERPDPMVVGSSPAMRRLTELALRAARTTATVLITGESGTGKELIARMVHQASSRANAPFVAINCAALPETLIESELFGHVKGAFSGAVSHRKGVFMEADGGTLLLDEIGEMPLSTQVKLLRVLQERVVRPLGGAGEKTVDVRVLATTNRDLTQEVAAGHFREDLLYRIQVINLAMPALRERREDIPLLVARFIDKSAKRYGLPVKGIEPAAMDCLMNYNFPGNVRELENLMEGMVSLAMGEKVEYASLPVYIRNYHASLSTEVGQEITLGDEGVDLEAILTNLESRLIRQALDKSDGNKTRAAELLKLSFRSFRYRLAKLGIESDVT
ncbi:MAG: sigma-54-dependent Fis family transcriptional regulator [Magnetococcales bacterium]|nr:sigma-54-dependent Fis family transcriptional regulator [Magnetococcales bacterium]NGZ26080.1 sigma-54-dependent Fis family transcriptional regulator [Magnetococcales bacterium]